MHKKPVPKKAGTQVPLRKPLVPEAERATELFITGLVSTLREYEPLKEGEKPEGSSYYRKLRDILLSTMEDMPDTNLDPISIAEATIRVWIGRINLMISAPGVRESDAAVLNSLRLSFEGLENYLATKPKGSKSSMNRLVRNKDLWYVWNEIMHCIDALSFNSTADRLVFLERNDPENTDLKLIHQKHFSSVVDENKPSANSKRAKKAAQGFDSMFS